MQEFIYSDADTKEVEVGKSTSITVLGEIKLHSRCFHVMNMSETEV